GGAPSRRIRQRISTGAAYRHGNLAPGRLIPALSERFMSPTPAKRRQPPAVHTPSGKAKRLSGRRGHKSTSGTDLHPGESRMHLEADNLISTPETKALH